MISINSNLSVLRVQNNMNKNIYMLGTALQRMSTGYKINSAADDTAGLYIATGLNTQVRGLTQAQTNVSMGQSVLNIAEGSLNNMSDMLNRIKDLALQGANSFYPADSREAMQKEADKLIEEINRINKSTNFNGMNVFGSVSEAVSSNVGVSNVSSDVVTSGYTAIYTAEDLNNVRNNLSGNYILMADIDLSSIDNWVPIGSGNSSAFKGIFDGNGHVIKNMTINRPDTKRVGLFGYTESGSEIKNLGLENVDVKGKQDVGGLVGGNNGGTITNCYVTGNVSGNAGVGGLVGWAVGTISNCYATGNVSGNEEIVGGLVGYNQATISYCYATGNVSGNKFDGGLVGYASSGTITNSYATGNVSGNNYVGGLVGYNYNTISNCYATGNVSGILQTGLICGWVATSSCKITNVWADKKDSTLDAFGNRFGIITNSYAVEHSEFTSHEFWDKQGLDSDVWEMSCSIPPVLKGVGTNNINWYFGRGNNENRIQTGEGSDPSANSVTINTGLDLGAMKVDFSTVEGCLDAFKCAQAAIDAISKRCANIGTTQNRFDSVQQSQITQIENAASAKSTIIDADIAQESAEYTKQQILTQTSSALLMQAKNLDTNTVTNIINSLR